MDFLLYWSTTAQIVFVAVVFGIGSIVVLYAVRRWVPLDRLQKNHEVAGVTFTVVGAFYGLVLAFVIVAAWERFNIAVSNVNDEATALETLYKLGAAFPDPMRTQLDSAVLAYTRQVIDVEWPTMAQKNYEPAKMGAHKLWNIILSYRPTDAHDQMLLDKAFDEITAVSQARSMRFLFYKEDLPSVVWFVIYLGCLITIGFSYFFGSHIFRAQVLMCGFFSVLLGVTILAILELAHPYQGVVTISDEPFRYALSRMQEVNNYKMSDLAPAASTPARSSAATANIPTAPADQSLSMAEERHLVGIEKILLHRRHVYVPTFRIPGFATRSVGDR
jgi:hypothetical protein